MNFSVTHGPYRIGHLDELCGSYPDECGALEDRERFNAHYDTYTHPSNYRALSFDFPNAAPRLGLTGQRLEEFAAVLELAYKSNVFYLDQLFGEIVDAIDGAGLVEESLITFVADHGEILYRDNAHFQWTHGLQLAPEVLTVPAFLLAPGLLEPRRYEGAEHLTTTLHEQTLDTTSSQILQDDLELDLRPRLHRGAGRAQSRDVLLVGGLGVDDHLSRQLEHPRVRL